MSSKRERDGEENSQKEEPLKLEFKEGELVISFQHGMVVTPEEAETRREVFRQKFSRRVGREIPIEEVYISPVAGETFPVTTRFIVKPGEPLYFGLTVIHFQNRGVVPKLITDLAQYRDQHKLEEPQALLLHQALGELGRISKLKGRVVFGKSEILSPKPEKPNFI